MTEGDPPLIVSWFGDGQSLVKSDTVYVTHIDSQTSLLAITQLGQQHTGNYTCQAKNEVSTVSVTSRLVVLGEYVHCTLSFCMQHQFWACPLEGYTCWSRRHSLMFFYAPTLAPFIVFFLVFLIHLSDD